MTRAQRREANTKEIRRATLGYSLRDVNRGFQFRVNGVLDLYPTRIRFHNIKTGERGAYPPKSLRAFIENQMARAAEKEPTFDPYKCAIEHDDYLDERRNPNLGRKEILQ